MIYSFSKNTPQIHLDAFVHPNATVIGQITIGQGTTIWPGVVMRGDMGLIQIGENTSIQDGTICHLTESLSQTIVGNRVTVGHGAILHGCVVEDECLIGMGSILLDNCKIGKGSLIAAGALVTVGKEIPPNSVVMGSPGKVVRETNDKEKATIQSSWKTYVKYGKRFKSESKLVS